MKVAVCGDSFMAIDPTAKGKHFSEMLDFDVTNYAHIGVGNVDICFQIQQAIKDKSDCVLIGTTDSARMVMPIGDDVIDNLEYRHFRDGADKKYYSATIPTFIGDELDLKNVLPLSQEQRDAVKKYFIHIFDRNVNSLVDRWCLQYWYSQLQMNGIRYRVLSKESFCIYTYKQNRVTDNWTFHTDFETQAIAAEILNRELA